MFRTLMSLLLCAFVASPILAQDQAAKPKKETKAPMKVVLDGKGNLQGKVFANVAGKKKPVEAKMTLIREGVTVKSVYSDEKGSFNFGDVPVGNYSVSGSASSYVGLEPIAVVAPAAPQSSGFADNSFVLSQPAYGSMQPAMSYSSVGGGGGGGGFGGGGGLLGNRRLLRLGLIGGIVAIAVSGDDDASPDGN